MCCNPPKSMPNQAARAKMLMEVAAKYLRARAPDGVIHYDDADCDSWCLADDLLTEAAGLGGA